MAQRVVDELEVVEVDEQHGALRAVVTALREDLLHGGLQRRAVGQAGERVL